MKPRPGEPAIITGRDRPEYSRGTSRGHELKSLEPTENPS
jgi:hypothetical protein